MSDPAGLALLAVFVLIFVCLIPQLVSQRRIASETRLEDRHSERLRVVAAAAPRAKAVAHQGPSTAPILAKPAWNPEGRSVMVRPPANARHAKAKVDIPAPVRLTRAEAARRRGVVALTLTALTLVAVALLIIGALPAIVSWILVIGPAAGLIATIAFGRRAASANARADAEYLARLERRQEARAHPKPVSESAPFRDLADGEPKKAPKAPARAAAPKPAIHPQVAPVVKPAKPAREAGAGIAAAGDAVAGVAAAADIAAGEGAAREEGWTPVEVPKPSYTTKPKAPRWVPEPLRIADLHGAAEDALSHTVLSTGAPQDDADEDGPLVQYSEIDLDAIMERRRVV